MLVIHKKNRLIKLQNAIAKIDKLVALQLTKLLSHPDLQKLLSLWLSLFMLCDNKVGTAVLIKLLDISSEELAKDVTGSAEIDHSCFFNKVYDQELGLAGGEPFSLMLVDYNFDLTNRHHISLCQQLAHIACYSLCPIITNLYYDDKSTSLHHAIAHYSQDTHLRWHRFRQETESRFITIAAPGLKYAYSDSILLGYKFNISLGGNSVVALRIMKSFIDTRWFSQIPGKVKGTIATHSNSLFLKNISLLSADFYCQSDDDYELVNLGVTPIIQTNAQANVVISNTTTAFLSNQAYHYSLEHMMCACRIAHYIRTIARQKIGQYLSEDECEDFVKAWLNKITATAKSAQLKAKYPLQSFNVKILPVPGKVGYYSCRIVLEPHMRLENLNSKVVLHSEIISEN